MEETEDNSENGPIPKSEEPPPSPLGRACALCGCSTPAVRCDRCSSQTFCLSCDDMYHRHPKRKLHLRKAVDSIWSSARSPRLRRRTELPGDPSRIPIPPPRSKKRERHTVGGRLFLKPMHELGSFGHSKVDIRNIPKPTNNVSAGLKTPTSLEDTYENDGFCTRSVENIPKSEEIYENENVPMNQEENVDNSNPLSRSPWNLQRTNISSPIQVSIPSGSPDLIANGQPFGYPTKQSRSIADLSGGPPSGFGHPYHPPHYPYMHPSLHPPYSHSMAHLNCAQCLSSSWSNLMSPHPSPFFHPMPWGSAQGSLARGHPHPAAANGHMKHSHGGDLPTFPDPNFHYPYPGGPYYPNGMPIADPAAAARQMHQQSEAHVKKNSSRQSLNVEEMDSEAADNTGTDAEETNPDAGSAAQDPDEDVPIPEKPTEPWSCVHCTFINPPGSHICQVCCKTSFAVKQTNSQRRVRPTDVRDSESPAELVNLDAISPPSHFTKHKEVQKVN